MSKQTESEGRTDLAALEAALGHVPGDHSLDLDDFDEEAEERVAASVAAAMSAQTAGTQESSGADPD